MNIRSINIDGMNGSDPVGFDYPLYMLYRILFPHLYGDYTSIIYCITLRYSFDKTCDTLLIRLVILLLFYLTVWYDF